MTRIAISNQDWVVVCDGRKALVLRNAGDEKFLNLKVIEERAIANPPTAAQGVDRPGRVYQSMNSGRSAVGQTDWHDEAERKFLSELAAWLHRAALQGEVKGLLLVAPPRALGMIRPALSPAVAKLLRGQMDKDLVNLPVPDIEKHLAA
jgi:protein required for attachment to host cells